jgi:apolipoprotein D and lipocalin family protein
MRRTLFIALSTLILAACATGTERKLAPVALVPHVDIPRFMGDWHVIAAIPTMFEKGAYNSMDSYRLEADGTIATTFSYNADSPDGPCKTMKSRGYVLDEGMGAIWGQQYIWPIKADYRISYLSPDYQHTVITREKRDYVWIMSRTPTMSPADLDRLTAFVASQGYDASKLQRVVQTGASCAPSP